MEIINKILEWPIIVQGALGSGLFWALLVLGQYLTKIIHGLVVKYSNKRTKKIEEIDLVILKTFLTQNDLEKTIPYLLLIYASVHYVIKAFVFFGLGWFFDDLIPVFNIIGYLVGFYFLFRAISHVPHLDKYSSMSTSERKKRASELESKRANKATAADVKSRAAD